MDADALVASIAAHGHRRALKLSGFDDLAAFVRREAQSGDVVVCLGAGDITAHANALPAKLAGN